MSDKYKADIIKFYQRYRRLPSYGEMALVLGFKSKNAAWKLAQKWIAEGFIRKDSRGKLAPHNFYGDIKKLGTVEAGFPSAAEEELADTISLDEYLVENRQASYILKVKGESMIDAGIRDGDMVIVQRNLLPRDGDIVIAEIDDGWTMKYYRKHGQQVYLEPANAKFKPIYPKNELKIAAVVKAVVRKY